MVNRNHVISYIIKLTLIYKITICENELFFTIASLHCISFKNLLSSTKAESLHLIALRKKISVGSWIIDAK